mmetsp:Transcript_17533/g.51923  ORF Transcript_17533/g.51923 Transcript_17533/m.51923 type:complete len:493 (-) Transcript_17533:93-1571(-)
MATQVLLLLLVVLVLVLVPAPSMGTPSMETPRHHRRRLRGTANLAHPADNEYSVRHFTQTTDHFNAETSSGTFLQRYLLTDKYYTNGSGAPIFVFTGAEGGDVTGLYGYAYGHPRAVARTHRALIVFLEHRFFGHSLPFGNGSASDAVRPDRIGLLSVEQALADYASIIYWLREEYGAWDAQVVTFGGSLAGTLSALMRVRYPALVDIAWASSTPLLGYPSIAGVSQYSWRKQVTDNFELLSPGCPALVRQAFAALGEADSTTVQKVYNVCEKTYSGLVGDVQEVAWGVLEGDGEFTYPSATSAIPAHCHAMRQAPSDLSMFAALIRIGAAGYLEPAAGMCLNLTKYKEGATTHDAVGWDFLACTEIVHPIGCNNVTDMFPPYNWTVAGQAAYCGSQFHVLPRPDWIPQQFGLSHIHGRFSTTHTRILFMYGLMDPWHTLGVGVTNLSVELPVVVAADGSHCADMEEGQPGDSKTMLAARARAETILAAWLE